MGTISLIPLCCCGSLETRQNKIFLDAERVAIGVAAAVGGTLVILGMIFCGSEEPIGFIACIGGGSICLLMAIGRTTFIVYRSESKTEKKKISAPPSIPPPPKKSKKIQREKTQLKQDPPPESPKKQDSTRGRIDMAKPQPLMSGKKVAHGVDSPPDNKIETPPSNNKVASPIYGHMVHASNFCYGSSTIAFLFLGTNLFVHSLKFSPQRNICYYSHLNRQKEDFLDHLANQVVAPLRAGKNIDLQTMEKCQSLGWEIWKEKHPHKKVQDRLYVRDFLTFLFHDLALSPLCNPRSICNPPKSALSEAHVYQGWDPFLYARMGKKEYSTTHCLKKMLDQHLLRFPDNLNEKQKRDLAALQNWGTLYFDRGALIFLEGFGQELHGEIEEKIPIPSIIPDRYGANIQNFYQGHYLLLQSILVCNPKLIHAYTFIRLSDDQWLKHDDLEVSNQTFTFEDMKKDIRHYGQCFLYEKHS